MTCSDAGMPCAGSITGEGAPLPACSELDFPKANSTLPRDESTAPASGAAAAQEICWLNDAEKRAWLAFWAASRLVDDEIDRDLRVRSGLSHGDYQILAILSGMPGRQLRMAVLADLVYVSRSRLTYQVTQLVKGGILRREDCSSDKRGAIAVLTDHGMDVLREAAPGHVACVRRAFFDALAPVQIAVVGDALGAVVARALEDPARRELARLWDAAV